jgi:hypothetical protein
MVESMSSNNKKLHKPTTVMSTGRNIVREVQWCKDVDSENEEWLITIDW